MEGPGAFVLCQTYGESVNWMARMKNIEIHPVFPFHYVDENQHKEFLRAGEGSSEFGVVVDFLDERTWTICNFLEIGFVFFRLDMERLIETASILRKALSGGFSSTYVVIEPKLEEWMKLRMVLNGKDGLFAAVSMDEDMEMWNTASVLAYVAKREFFTTKEKDDHYMKLLEQYPRSFVAFLECFPMREIACRMFTKACKADDCDAEVYDPLITITGKMQKTAYENMEKDKAKYGMYAKAIEEALKANPDAVFAFLGAGRGPNVTAAIKMGAKRIFVLDKNMGTSELLKRQKKSVWPDFVEVVEGDMRDLVLPQKVDILVTELLGSFGDNELDPECLQFCDRFMSPRGICIPQYYKSLLVPITAENLWSKAMQDKSAEKMLVCDLHRAVLLSEPKECFEYKHPGQNELYQRKILVFDITRDGIIHGFGGWFECTLCDGIEVSNHPDAGSNSWFISYFPISVPFLVRKGQQVRLCFERKGNSQVVWYEWCITHPTCTKIHNAGGTAFAYRLR